MSANRFEVIKETDDSRPCRLYIRSGCRNVLASVNDDPQTIELFTLFAAAPEMLEALKIGRRAIGEHHKPTDCYATGPLTGNHYADLVQCPACLFIHMYDAAIAKAEGRKQ